MRLRSAALTLSAVLHAAALALVGAGSTTQLAMRTPAMAVEQVSAEELAGPDQRLPTPDAAPIEATFEASEMRTGATAFDIAKIRSRENALFP